MLLIMCKATAIVKCIWISDFKVWMEKYLEICEIQYFHSHYFSLKSIPNFENTPHPSPTYSQAVPKLASN